MHLAADSLQESGFLVTDRDETGVASKALDYELALSEGAILLPIEKAGLLRETLRWMVSRSYVNVADLST